jgi:hypothetical protein
MSCELGGRNATETPRRVRCWRSGHRRRHPRFEVAYYPPLRRAAPAAPAPRPRYRCACPALLGCCLRLPWLLLVRSTAQQRLPEPLELSLAGGHCSLLLRPPQPGGEDRLSCQNADEISELLKVTVRVRNFQGRTLLSVEIFKSVLPRSKGPPRVQLRFLSCARPLITGLSCSIRLISCRCAPCLGLVLLRVVVVGVQS